MAGEKTQPKRLGRPPKSAERPKNGSFTFRIRPEMREKLEASAKLRNVSISEEIEHRINLSFDIATSPQNEYLILSAATGISLVEGLTNNDWGKDKLTAYMAHSAVVAATSVMTAIHDKADDEEESALIKAAGEVLGIRSALMLAGLPTGSVVKFGSKMIDLAIDVLRSKIVIQARKAADRDPDAIAVEIDSDENRGLGAPYPPIEQHVQPEELPQITKRRRKVKF